MITYTFSEDELKELKESIWIEAYRKGNLDGYFGERTEWKKKFPNAE